jgi:hypothetical protein
VQWLTICFPSQPLVQFVRRGRHESALSRDGHAVRCPIAERRNWLRQELCDAISGRKMTAGRAYAKVCHSPFVAIVSKMPRKIWQVSYNFILKNSYVSMLGA